MKKIDTALIILWDNVVGAVSWLDDSAHAVFEYDPNFLKKAWDIAPLTMRIEQARQSDGRFAFSSLNKETFLGLPGLLADALPDKFGNNMIDAWLASQGRDSNSFSPVERLCYMGKRAMGALEFQPMLNHQLDSTVSVEIPELVALAQQVMSARNSLNTHLGETEKDNAEALKNILRIGTSAGGARPKAIIAMNADSHVVSGQAVVPKGYDYWLLKFDGVMDLELGEPRGYGRIEYAYYLMAKAAGITMSESRLLEENGRAHFMTKRFDRVAGEKIHMQSLCGIAHFDYNMSGTYSYEQAFSVMRQLGLSQLDLAEQYRRMVFNVAAKNLDDHTKNIAFLMGQDGRWSLSPAYDMTYSHNPAGQWTNRHQMSVNNKRENITRNDLITVADNINLKKADAIIDGVLSALAQWPTFAQQVGLNKAVVDEIAGYHFR